VLPAGVECDGAAVDVGGPVVNVLADEWTGGCHLGVGLYPRGAGVDVVVALHVEGEYIAGRPTPSLTCPSPRCSAARCCWPSPRQHLEDPRAALLALR